MACFYLYIDYLCITMTDLIIPLLSIALVAAAAAIIFILKHNRRLSADNRRLTVEKAVADERLSLLQQQMLKDNNSERDRFSSLAAEALRRNSQTLTEQSRSQIAELLAPMKENLDNFRRAYTDAYGKEAEKRAMLDQQLRELFSLNRTIGDETRRLGEALRGNTSVQGAWGEMVLENILERSGLLRGQDYFVQKTVDDQDSRVRPDIVITCPGKRNIVVDSKVSLTDYIKMLNATDRAAARACGEAHVASVRKHVAELKRKNYQDLLDGNNADFVMMFIPHEGAYLAAMQLDDTLWQTAFDSRVIIVSPTHLVSVVKLVEQMWRQDKQNRNAVEIADLGARMLDKLANFIADLNKIKNSLDSARRSYDSAMVRLEGRGGIRSIAEDMRDKGIKGARDLPPRSSAG